MCFMKYCYCHNSDWCCFFQDFILEINEQRYRITELENEKLQYEKKLKSTKVSFIENTIFQSIYFPELKLSAT